MNPLRASVCAVVFALGTGCATASVEPTPSGTPVSIGGQAAAIGCGNDRELRTPDGREVNLTGLWTSPDFPDVTDEPLWNIRQVGDCFFMVFRDPYEDTDYSDQICDGRIQANFEIVGRCVDFRGFGTRADLQPQVFLILTEGNVVRIQRCPASRALGSCEAPMTRFDPEATPAESASPG